MQELLEKRQTEDAGGCGKPRVESAGEQAGLLGLIVAAVGILPVLALFLGAKQNLAVGPAFAKVAVGNELRWQELELFAAVGTDDAFATLLAKCTCRRFALLANWRICAYPTSPARHFRRAGTAKTCLGDTHREVRHG